jgi:hypothetical protein
MYIVPIGTAASCSDRRFRQRQMKRNRGYGKRGADGRGRPRNCAVEENLPIFPRRRRRMKPSKSGLQDFLAAIALQP